MRVLSADKLNVILEKHKKWLYGDESSERADLRGVDLRTTELSGKDLRKADLCGADLRGAELDCANLQYADLGCADLRGANLKYANLQYTNLKNADLHGISLYGADLRYTIRPWLIYLGSIGSRYAETLYLADIDHVQCGCWNDYRGGSLAEFRARIDDTYSDKSENKNCQWYRFEYLNAIKVFNNMRKAYLAETLKYTYFNGDLKND
jgi:hypothetical protein